MEKKIVICLDGKIIEDEAETTWSSKQESAHSTSALRFTWRKAHSYADALHFELVITKVMSVLGAT